MESNRHLPTDREPAEAPREDRPPTRDKQPDVEPEEPQGRATRGTTNRGSAEAGWTPPRRIPNS